MYVCVHFFRSRLILDSRLLQSYAQVVFFKSLKSEMRIKVRIYNSENVYINNHNNNSHINDQNKMIIIMKGDNDDINNYNNNDI